MWRVSLSKNAVRKLLPVRRWVRKTLRFGRSRLRRFCRCFRFRRFDWSGRGFHFRPRRSRRCAPSIGAETEHDREVEDHVDRTSTLGTRTELPSTNSVYGGVAQSHRQALDDFDAIDIALPVDDRFDDNHAGHARPKIVEGGDSRRRSGLA